MNNDFVIRGSMCEVYESLPLKEGTAYLRALMEYGVTGEYAPVEYNTVEAILAGLKPGIDKSKARYLKSMDDGKKGGRVKKVNYIDAFVELQDGHSIKEIAERFKVSESTIKRTLDNPPKGKDIYHSINNSRRVAYTVNSFVGKAVQRELKKLGCFYTSAMLSYYNRAWEKRYKPEDYEKRFEGSAAGRAYRASRMAFTDLSPEEQEERDRTRRELAYLERVRRRELNDLRRETEKMMNDDS